MAGVTEMTMMKGLLFRITGLVRLSKETWVTKAIGETRITRMMR